MASLGSLGLGGDQGSFRLGVGDALREPRWLDLVEKNKGIHVMISARVEKTQVEKSSLDNIYCK